MRGTLFGPKLYTNGLSCHTISWHYTFKKKSWKIIFLKWLLDLCKLNTINNCIVPMTKRTQCLTTFYIALLIEEWITLSHVSQKIRFLPLIMKKRTFRYFLPILYRNCEGFLFFFFWSELCLNKTQLFVSLSNVNEIWNSRQKSLILLSKKYIRHYIYSKILDLKTTF
jgi:hypothetical protein